MNLQLSEQEARRYAQIALGHVAREYPHKLDHVMGAGDDVKTPSELHPAFFGSFDWHSCVHSWWMLLTLRRLYPDMPEADEIARLADETYTAEKLAAELAYFQRPDAHGFERPYGWAWLFALHLEAARHRDRPWGSKFAPLTELLSDRLANYLNKMIYPIYVGTHYNTAFALVLALDWAHSFDDDLFKLIHAYADQAYGKKGNYSGWEPGGDEFLSPVLSAALLVSRTMPRDQFIEWFDQLVLANGWIEHNCHPVTVSDRSDGKIAHLDGLNLSRAWCLWGIAEAIGPDAPELLDARAQAHFDAAIPHLAGDYMGEHWLASFALLAWFTKGAMTAA